MNLYQLKCRFLVGVFFVSLLVIYAKADMPEPPHQPLPWLPRPDKVTMMAVCAHPDDEGIFFGGALPYYSSVLKLPTLLISMTSGDWDMSEQQIREEEIRKAAWVYGLRFEPLFPRFRDVSQNLSNPYPNSIDAVWDFWADGKMQGNGSDVEAGKAKAINYVAEQIRRYKPDVIFTHDLNGEYGHNNHKATGISVSQAFRVAADPNATATNLAGLPPWQASKIYVHLYPSNRLFHTKWESPYEELNGRTPRQVTNAGLTNHVTQGRVSVSTYYQYGENFDGFDSEWWGLFDTAVGPDTCDTNGVARGDFLEHIYVPKVTAGPDQYTTYPWVVVMNTTVNAQDMPTNRTLAIQWSKLVGPGQATFVPSDQVQNPSVSFDRPGTYTLQIQVTDGYLTNSSSLNVVAQEGNYQFRMPVQFPGYSQAEPLTNFPVLLTLGEHLPGFRYADSVSSNGCSLRFTDSRRELILSHEVELWNTNGISKVWVKVPCLNSNTIIYAWWSNVAVTNVPAWATNGSTWSEGYSSVWHLDDSTNGAIKDSSQNSFHGRSLGNTNTPGYLADSQGFGNTNSIQLDYNYKLNPENLTVEAWVRMDEWHGDWYSVITSRESNHKKGFILYAHPAGYWQFWTGSGSSSVGWDTLDGAWITLGKWTHLTAVYDASTSTKFFYTNGVLARFKTNALYSFLNTTNPMIIGRGGDFGDQFTFPGVIDEVRVSSMARSSNWVQASYLVTASNDTFCSFGSVQNVPTTLPDQDANGIPDYWQKLYFGGATNGVMTADDDGDGVSNYDEWIADTNPLDSSSRVKVLDTLKTNGVGLNINTSSNRVYSLEYLDVLGLNPIWNPIPEQTQIPGTGTNLILTDPSPSSIRFYRIKVQLP